MKKQLVLPKLVFFNSVEEKLLRQENIASSLQSIETGLFLIGTNRWPTVLSLLFEATENLIKHDLKPKKGTAFKLIPIFLKKHHLPSELIQKADAFRLLRNHMVHEGYSPKDDNLVIKTTFNSAIPFLDAVFQVTFKQSVFDLISGTVGQEWIADTYKKTLKLVIKKTNQKDSNLTAALLLLNKVFKRTLQTSYAHSAFTVGSELEVIMEEEYGHIAFDIKNRLYFKFLKDFKSDISQINYDRLLHIPNLACLDCEQDTLIGAISLNVDELFDNVQAFGCCRCGFKIWDRDVCDVFVTESLDQEQISTLQNVDTPEAEDGIPLGYHV